MNSHNIDALISKIDIAHHNIQSDVIKSISSGLTWRNWIINQYIVEYEQNGDDRAKYGVKLLLNLSKSLSRIKGISINNLQSFRLYPQISQSVTGKSIEVPINKLLKVCTFAHFVELIKLDNNLFVSKYKINLPFLEEIEELNK